MTIIKDQLLQDNKKALQFLHHAAGFDFEQDYFITKSPGKFTYNTIINTVKNSFSDPYKVVIFVKPVSTSYKTNELYFAVVEGGKIDGTRREGVKYYKYNKIAYAWGVGDFEKLRKNDTECIYIIAQRADLMKRPEEKTIDFSSRYTVTGTTKATDQNRSCVWVSNIDLLSMDGSGDKFEYKPFSSYSPREPKTDIITDYIDKSGYFVRPRREELKSSAARLRAGRAKAAADAANYDNNTIELSKQIETVKTFLAAAVSNAANYDQMRAINKKIDSFSWVLFEFDLYNKRLSNKEYSSVKNIEKAIQEMTEKLNKIMEV